MAEESDPFEIGRRIAREYLSKRGWAGEWRRSLSRQIYPAFLREELEAKERQVDQMEEDAEALFSQEYDRWRKEPEPASSQVLRGIQAVIGRRTDLGLIAGRIRDRINRGFSPL
jgi:hypothetical protein